MPRINNYALMARSAQQRFLTYDQSAIIANIPLTFDAAFFYLPVLDRTCRIDRGTGSLAWSSSDGWIPTNDFHDVLTIFDYLCDAKPCRRSTGELRSMASFGHMFHTGLLENSEASPLEAAIDRDPAAFIRACEALGGTPFPNCDMGFTLPFFPDLTVTLQFWHSDDEFPARLRYLWDRSAADYLRYETMYYALNLIRSRLQSRMKQP